MLIHKVAMPWQCRPAIPSIQDTRAGGLDGEVFAGWVDSVAQQEMWFSGLAQQLLPVVRSRRRTACQLWFAGRSA
jgi:hypothetical protein